MENNNEAFTELMSRDYKLWSLAIETAEQSEYPKFRVGAAISCRWKLITRQTNKEKTHTQAAKEDYWSKSRHAEFDAIRAAKDNGDTIAVVRLAQDGRLLDSIPCFRCMRKIKESSIRWVICMINGVLRKCLASDLYGHIPQPAIYYDQRIFNSPHSTSRHKKTAV